MLRSITLNQCRAAVKNQIKPSVNVNNSRPEEGHPAAAIRARRKGESSWILLIPEARPDPYENLHTLWM